MPLPQHHKTRKNLKPQRRTAKNNNTPASDLLPLDLQQLILTQFQQTFPFSNAATGGSADLQTSVQTVKGHLYNRNFDLAFSQPAYREAYALRWSASRAVAYAHIFHNDLSTFLKWQDPPLAHGHPGEPSDHSSPYTVVCIGGGAGAEIVALASLLHTNHHHQTRDLNHHNCDHRGSQHPVCALHATAIDVADWSDVLVRLQATITQPPALSKYASVTARAAASRPLAPPDRWQSNFVHSDVLDMPQHQLQPLLAPASLCTIMFTLNELFAASVTKTTALLLKITNLMPEGSHLLVVDSPGSYSEVRLGQQANSNSGSTAATAKQYPMKWLLDHALLRQGQRTTAEPGKWVKVISDDSRWFRLPPDLKYPVDLENMRYQIHLYRRLCATQM